MGAMDTSEGFYMSLTIKQAKEILKDPSHNDAELQVILDACEELTDIFLEEVIEKKYGSKT